MAAANSSSSLNSSSARDGSEDSLMTAAADVSSADAWGGHSSVCKCAAIAVTVGYEKMNVAGKRSAIVERVCVRLPQLHDELASLGVEVSSLVDRCDACREPFDYFKCI